MKKNISVISLKEGYKLDNSITSKVLAFAFGLSAEIERTLISERTKQGLQRAKIEGKQIGRRKGQKVKHKLDNYKNIIKRKLNNNTSINQLSREYNVQWITMKKFILENKLA